MEVLYVVSEADPFVKSGGLGAVAGAFPAALAARGVQVRGIMPLYDLIPEVWREKMELVGNYTFPVALGTAWCGLYALEHRGVTWYFVENNAFFQREMLYGCRDDDARFAFFSKAVCAALEYLEWVPDVLHCNDWETALVPIYLRDFHMKHPEKKQIKTIFTIHNVEFQGSFQYNTLTNVFGLSGILFAEGTMELDGSVNLMKGAIEVSDLVTTVSPSYAEELSAPDASGPLSEVIARHRIVGIRNGVELPEERPDRAQARQALLAELDLTRGDGAVFCCVGRLLPRKGHELLLEAMPRFLAAGCRLAVIGDGGGELLERLRRLEAAHPGAMAVRAYSEDLAAQALSGADFLVMPSLEEPCGTVQMQAMGYGTVPIVRATGGLRDSVVPGEDGFVFEEYTPQALSEALEAALTAFRAGEPYRRLQESCLSRDFSWDAPAEAYLRLYQGL